MQAGPLEDNACTCMQTQTGLSSAPPPSFHRHFAILLGLLAPCYQPLPTGESQTGPGWPRPETQGAGRGGKGHELVL